MEIDYIIVGLVVLAAVVFVIWLIRRNMKDKVKFEKDVIKSDLKPEKHDSDHV